MEEKYYVWDGKKNPRKRLALKIECSYCGVEFLRAKRSIRDKKNYCCKEHANKDRLTKVSVDCSYCGKTKTIKPSQYTKSITKHFFCDRTCQNNAQITENTPSYSCNYVDGGSSYRGRSFKEYLHKCSICGYDEVIDILEVHHIDGDRTNNGIDNLIILCPNHHRMLTLKLATLNEDRTLNKDI